MNQSVGREVAHKDLKEVTGTENFFSCEFRLRNFYQFCHSIWDCLSVRLWVDSFSNYQYKSDVFFYSQNVVSASNVGPSM